MEKQAPMAEETEDNFSPESDFRTMIEHEKIRSNPDRLNALMKHAEHAKVVHGSIKQMQKAWQNKRNESAMKNGTENCECGGEGCPVCEKRHKADPGMHSKAIPEAQGKIPSKGKK